MNKKNEDERFEFLLYINKNIICQRFFSVWDFNQASLKSLEIKELMDNIAGMNNGDYGDMGIIPKYLKRRAIDFLWKENSYYFPKKEDTKPQTTEDFIFDFVIKVDKNVVAQSTFSGNVFPKHARSQVDIKEIIPDITSEIRYYLSREQYTTEYANVQL